MPRRTKANPREPTWVFRHEFPTELPGLTRKHVFDEMHSVETLIAGADAPDKAFTALLTPNPSKTFEEFAEGLRQVVNKELARLRLPPGEMEVLVKGAKWDLLVERPPEGSGRVRMELGYAYTLARSKEFSTAWFLAKIAKALLTLEYAVGDQRSWAIFNLARLLEVREHRVHFPKILHAANHRRGVVAAAETNMKRNKQNRDAVVNKMRELLSDPQIKPKAAATSCLALGLGTSVGGNLKYWQRYRDSGQ